MKLRKKVHHSGNHLFVVFAHGDVLEATCDLNDLGAFCCGGHCGGCGVGVSGAEFRGNVGEILRSRAVKLESRQRKNGSEGWFKYLGSQSKISSEVSVHSQQRQSELSRNGLWIKGPAFQALVRQR
jgi:hypothetical protein